MKRLIINADDFGLSPEVNDGIVACHRAGAVTAASCLVNMPGFEQARRHIEENPRLDPGLHLNFTWGAPLLGKSVPLLAPGGRFRSRSSLALALALGRVPGPEIRAEAEAQIDRFASDLGIPSHLDVHQHFHTFAGVFEPVARLAAERRIPFLRLPRDSSARGPAYRYIAWRFRRRMPPLPVCSTDHFRGLSEAGRLDRRAIDRILDSLEPGLTELMVHPGYGRVPPGAPDRLAGRRAAETEALLDPELPSRLENLRIVLTSFREEAKRSGSPTAGVHPAPPARGIP